MASWVQGQESNTDFIPKLIFFPVYIAPSNHTCFQFEWSLIDVMPLQKGMEMAESLELKKNVHYVSYVSIEITDSDTILSQKY